MVILKQLPLIPCFYVAEQRFVISASVTRCFFICTWKLRRCVMVFRFMLQTPFGRHPCNNSWELKYLISIVCRCFETLTWPSFLCIIMYDSWIVNFHFFDSTSQFVAFLDVGPPSDWGVLTPGKNDRICSRYGECATSFYECIFSILGLRLPFNVFEVEVLKHLIVATSQLYFAS